MSDQVKNNKVEQEKSVNCEIIQIYRFKMKSLTAFISNIQ